MAERLCGVTGAVCDPFCGLRPGLCGIYTVGWPDDSDLAALYLWDGSRGVVWMNWRLVHGSLVHLVHLWARQRIYTGRHADVLPVSALPFPTSALDAAV